MDRNTSSHKGENGKVAIIGGSRTMHGAPLFAALATEASGVDLIHVCLPDWHENAAKEASLNFQVHAFDGDSLTAEHVEPIVELLATMDSAVIGPGIARDLPCIEAAEAIIAEASCPLVIDATALQPSTFNLVKAKRTVLTPHLGELERMGLHTDGLPKAAEDSGTVIFLKDEVDNVYSPQGEHEEITGGNAGLTVGGTGDALSGLIAGLIAQEVDPFEAAVTAGTIIKRAGALLYPEKGFAYTTSDVIQEIPKLLHSF